jgi:exopolysaccharide transport family protein
MPDTGEFRFPSVQVGETGRSASDVGLQSAFDMFRRRLWLMAAVAGVVALAMALQTLSRPPVYTATTQILIENRERRVVDLEAVVSGLPASSAVVDTETEILRSRDIAGRVVDANDLTGNPEFNPPLPPPNLLQRFAMLFRRAPVGAPDPAVQARIAREIAISRLLERVTVERTGATFMISVSVSSQDAVLAALLSNSYADQYMNAQRDTKYQAITKANEWLSDRLDALRDEVRAKEQAVEAFRAQSGLLAAAGETLNESQMAAMNMQLITSRQDLAERQARLEAVRSSVANGGGPESLGEALSSRVVGDLRAQQADLARQRAEASTRYGPRHPELQRLQRESADIDSRLNDEVNRIISNLRAEVDIARNRVNSIEGDIARQRSRLVQNNQGSVRLRELERDAEATRTLYEAFLNRFKETAEQSGITEADARIMSRAMPPLTPSSPNVPLSLILGVLLGVVAGAATALVMEFLERSLRTPEDVQLRLGAPCLGMVPFLDRKTRLVDGDLVTPENFVLKRPLSAFGEALRGIRATALFSRPDRNVKVLAVTSSLPEEGKTTTAIGLARMSALAGSRTVLVDCDLRRRSATYALGMDVDKGLTEVLFRTAHLRDVIRKDEASDLDVVPLAQTEFTSRDLFASDAMRTVIDQLKSAYDVVILDTAPVMPIADARVLAPLADGVLVIARWGKTPHDVVRNCLTILKDHGANVIGVVLDGVNTGPLGRLIYNDPRYYHATYRAYYVH